MITSVFEVEVQVEPTSETQWCIMLQVNLNGKKCVLDNFVDNFNITSENENVQVIFLGNIDPHTAVFQAHTEEFLLSVPLTITVTPLYSLSSSAIYILDSRLADFVGREYLVHPKYALTCINSYVRTNNLYAGKSIMCDENLEKLFGTIGIRIESLWSRITKLMKKKEFENINLLIELSDFRKTYHQRLEVNQTDDKSIYPSFYMKDDSSISSRYHRTNSLVPISTGKKIKSFKRNKSLS